MKIGKQPIQGSAGIQIKAPVGLSVDGDTKVVPREVDKKLSRIDRVLQLLYSRVSELEAEKFALQELIEVLEKDL